MVNDVYFWILHEGKGGGGDTTTGFRVLHLTEKWKNIQILGRECRPVWTDQLGVTRTSIFLLYYYYYERVRYLRRPRGRDEERKERTPLDM